jgi:hypothetical protein
MDEFGLSRKQAKEVPFILRSISAECNLKMLYIPEKSERQ